MTRPDHLTAPETAAKLADLSQLDRGLKSPTKLTDDVHKDTVLITVVDVDGMAVSLIYSIFASFGSCIASEKFGVLFHNRGCGFSLTHGHPNEAGPGKRPMHTIIPAMQGKNGQINMAFGVMGGQYQATGHAHLFSNLHDFGMDIQEAIDAPRAFADPIGGMLQVEDTLDETTISALADMGHKIARVTTPIGGAQAIQIDHERGLLIAGSDPRTDGCAIGY
jgi:gamma-glutamyltranspeptidase/glutathione hydrolase